jgi:hypothetical protein
MSLITWQIMKSESQKEHIKPLNLFIRDPKHVFTRHKLHMTKTHTVLDMHGLYRRFTGSGVEELGRLNAPQRVSDGYVVRESAWNPAHGAATTYVHQ